MTGASGTAVFDNPLSLQVWRDRYRYAGSPRSPEDRSIHDTWRRVARAAASAETAPRTVWESRFYDLLDGFGFLPAGRILAGADTAYQTTLCNCFVIGLIEDSLEGIFDRLKESAITMQWGGGIGCDFSTLRPRGSVAHSRGVVASGPVSFMRVWDAMCATLVSTGARRGAMMATLRCDHPDIEDFIDAKRAAGALTNFNLSIQATDAFMRAVETDAEWPLVFPAANEAGERAEKLMDWPGRAGKVACAIDRRLSARALWQRLVDAAYETAEPGLLFVDRINRLNNLHYREHLTATNPCGEVPLPPHGACVLGSINLAAFVESPFTRRPKLNLERIADVARHATRFLDNVIEIGEYPFEAQAAEARGTRRVGLGVTGLADALILLGQHYDSDAARDTARGVLRVIRDAAYRASIELARDKGAFPYLARDAYLAGAYIEDLPAELRDGIAEHGIRNSHLISIAPAGTISVLANNVSSGIEPVFALEVARRFLDRDGRPHVYTLTDPAYAMWRESNPAGSPPRELVTAAELSPEAHLQMQAALQPLVDSAISKTINVAADIDKREFGRIYRRAFELGVKGCTVFRPSAVRGQVLSASSAPAEPRVHCCVIDRESD